MAKDHVKKSLTHHLKTEINKNSVAKEA